MEVDLVIGEFTFDVIMGGGGGGGGGGGAPAFCVMLELIENKERG